MARNIGVDVEPPKEVCSDPDCPFHGTLTVRGRIIGGRVINNKMQKTVTVQRDYVHFVRKYNRFERRRSNISAHNPPCIDAEIGDYVTIGECRPLSKSVSFVVISKRKGD
ncbi:MAG: 30S ribosomal protein S17 [Candidatus Ranarchaeia archaeon]